MSVPSNQMSPLLGLVGAVPDGMFSDASDVVDAANVMFLLVKVCAAVSSTTYRDVELWRKPIPVESYHILPSPGDVGAEPAAPNVIGDRLVDDVGI